MAKKGKQPSTYDASSVRFCPECRRDIRISFGGEKNWSVHLRSREHSKNAAIKKPVSITSFFKTENSLKSVPISTATSSTSATSLGAPALLLTCANLLPSDPDTQAQTSITELHVSSPIMTETQPPVPLDSGLALLLKIRDRVPLLPHSVDVGTLDDELAQFSVNPSLKMEDRDSDASVYVHDALAPLFGYNTSVESVQSLIRRGNYGIEGLCNWIESSIVNLGVDGVLLESILNKILQAINGLIPASPCPTSGQNGADKRVDIDNQCEIIDIDLFAPMDVPTPVPISSHVRETLPPIKDCMTAGTFPSSFEPDFRKIECHGYELKFPDSDSPLTSYPFAIHQNNHLHVPWSISVVDNAITLCSHLCPRNIIIPASDNDKPCVSCSNLHNHSIIMGIRHRAFDGADESTPWSYLAHDHLTALLQKKNEKITQLRLHALNAARKLGIHNTQLEAWKRFSVAIGTHDIPRLRNLITSELRRGGSVFAILTKVDRAVQKNYSPRGYERTDFERAYLIWKLGGVSAAEIAFRTLGLPSISATRRFVNITPLRLPSLQARQETSATLSDVYISVVMAMDEIKLQERLRWDERTNNILGVCREHGHKCSLQFRSLADADAILDAIQHQEVHFASLATVIGFFMLSESPQEYCFTPFVVSGTCSKGTVEMQQALIERSIKAIDILQRPLGRRLYSIASDGDSQRRNAFARITLVSELQPQSTIFPILSPLRLFNRKCGLDDLTCDFDWKHVLNLSILKKHLIDCGLPITTVEILLAPNDCQDVVLMLRLLNSISQIPQAKANDPPSVLSSQRIICLLGRLYHHLLNAYLDVSLSLSEQLAHLSAAAHIILAVYSRNKGDFIPAQLCYDTQSMVKNVYFTVAKAQWDRPLGKCHIILLGTDSEEKVFGQCRTMKGGDSGNDQLQLTNRLNGTENCVKILEEHPNWGGQSRRLKIQTLQNQGSEISRRMDHLNPRSWEGDVMLQNVTLLRCWKEGRYQAEKDLEASNLSPPFESMEEVGGFDILCPFGNQKIILVDGALSVGELDEAEDEILLTSTTGPEKETNNSLDSSNDGGELDLDDLCTSAAAVMTMPTPSLNSEPTEMQKAYEAWVAINPAQSSAILSLGTQNLLRGRWIHKATDRLRTVRGYTQYNESLESKLAAATACLTSDTLDDESDNFLHVEDPAVTLVRCTNLVFLAVVQVVGLQQDSKPVLSIPVENLHEPSTSVDAKILQLVCTDDELALDIDDWEWNGKFEQVSSFRSRLNGHWIDLFNPSV
ncbi:hypothetical protein IW261DRAFT_1612940 [Armillaria novae-zelandiae]|uniref:Uncharacterized protein n=1 Tax=Armillaria novae-zelandiae TaxID=153914 RepID=A0AA39NL60_9AGAR|nr:hypothetical protein IW261DRAFT_1612940 [Armillaria novae-zelandiae]